MGELKRYDMFLLAETLDKIKTIAKEEGVAAATIVRRFIKIGFLVYNSKKEGKTVFIKDGEEEKEFFFL